MRSKEKKNGIYITLYTEKLFMGIEINCIYSISVEEGLHLEEFQDIGSYDDYFSSNQTAEKAKKGLERTYELDREIESLVILLKFGGLSILKWIL
jgi:hypothetical protein